MKILCLDFDGVIHSYTSGWKGADVIPDDPVPGAIPFMYEALTQFEVCVFSSRSHQPGGIAAMRRWLDHHEDRWISGLARSGLPIPAPAQLGVHLSEALKWPTEKPPATVTIDDRAITFDGTWPSMELLAKFKPWNKRT